MKKTNVLRFIMVFVLVSVCAFLSGCDKHSDIKSNEISKLDPAIVQDSKDYYGKVITKNDFPINKLLSDYYANSLNNIPVIDDQPGSNPEMALVELIFDENNVLYTAKRYNSETEKHFHESNYDVGKHFYYTDVNTFHKVTNLPQATREYANVLPGYNGQAIWRFDPYVKFFTKRSDSQVKAIQKLKINNGVSNLKTSAIPIPAWSQLGNIIFVRVNSTWVLDNYGHTGGIVVSPQVSANINGAYMQSTKMIEVTNHGSTLAGVTFGTTNGVFERWMSNNGSDGWANSAVYARYAMWCSGMASAQRAAIVTYMRNQLGEDYNLSSSKTNETQWYCSKLQYMAYKSVLGIDIDYDGGSTVYPLDIVNSSQLVGMSFGLFQ